MLVFQYGSNCLESEINGVGRLRGDAKFVDVAKAEGFELVFDVQSRNRRCAASDIIAKAGSAVWGVLYEIPDDLLDRESARARGRKSLDAIEGEGTNYERRTIEVHRPNGGAIQALTYTVIAPQSGLKTNIEYVRHIIFGLREHGIEDDYVARVKAIASANNPDIAAQIIEL